MDKVRRQRGPYFIICCLGILISGFLINTGMKAYAQTQRKNEIKEEESFKRPEPSRPIQPEVPGVNRYQEDKVFLEYADSLYKVNNRFDTVERQILKGNVKFRQAGLWMFCDSAYYYPQQNSLDAFSNVRMEQGDTLFVYADKLFYNGDEHLAKLKNGPTRSKVTLINKDVTLNTDSLDYDMQIDLGWYTRWGTIDDKVNTLTSLYGEYSPRTKRAEFFTDVVLVNNKDGYTMLTDTLYYSTETHIANIESRTEIRSENDTIITNLATYYTDTGDADLLSRSMIIHRDSTGNVTTLEGDSIIYDNSTRVSRAYMFRDPFKRSAPMVITDTAQKTTLIGGFGMYNDSTREALATIYPLLMEYSQTDTLFLRADTIKTFIVTQMVPDKRRKTKSGFPEFNGEPIVKVLPDSSGLWIDTAFFKVEIPYIETPLLMLLKAAPPYKKPEPQPEPEPEPAADTLIFSDSISFPNDSVSFLNDSISLPNDSITISDIVEITGDSISLSQDVLMPNDSVSAEDLPFSMPSDTGIMKVGQNAENIVQSDSVIKADSIPVDFHVALAYHRARFFKQDMQGVADSMVFVEKDSMLYLFRKPIIWSEERQVTGNRIDVHFNDSTADWAYLPEFGLMSEYVDEDFYNQIYGKEIKTYFENGGLRRMNVSGNVETIFLPQEEDSTFNRLVNAESSYMEAYLDSNKLDWLKMWPEVSGSVTPIFLVKRNQMYLQKFKWWGFLRPKREWYGDRVKWADDLGEVPEELEQYFMTPSDFGEPKSFTGTRVILPPASLPGGEDLPQPSDNDSISEAILNVAKSETIQEVLDENLKEEEDVEATLRQSQEIENSVLEEESDQEEIPQEVVKEDLVPVKEEPETIVEDGGEDE